MIKKAFTFISTAKCEVTSHALDVACVFFGDKLPSTPAELFDELEAALKAEDTLPDCMAVIANTKAIQALHKLWEQCPEEKDNFVSRGIKNGHQYVKVFHFFEWNADEIKLFIVEGISPFELEGKTLIKGGLFTLARTNPVVQVAPSGHVFKHPSGTVNQVFIQARELAVSEPEMEFVGRAISSRFDAGMLNQADIVFIDTMSIYPFVKEALKFSGSHARIQSFHSYGGVEVVPRPIGSYAVVVSASTSGKMVNRLHHEQQFNVDRMLTMIDIESSPRLGHILLPLDAVEGLLQSQTDGGTETEIELVGEHFSSKAKPPRAVALGVPHQPKQLKLFLKNFGIGGIAELNHKPAETTRLKLVSLLSETIQQSKEFTDWLNIEVQWNVSASIDHIVHANDKSSKGIAEHIADRLAIFKGAPSKPSIVSYEEMLNGGLKTTNGVLVVTATCGNGGLLREISRDLRELLDTKIPRHFLVGVGLPETADAWNRLLQYLVRNATDRFYGFSVWLMLPVGSDSERNVWTALSDLAAKSQFSIKNNYGLAQGIIDKSLDAACKLVEKCPKSFLPKSSGQDLGLSEGFLFFGDAFKDRLSEVIPATTYLTVASVMQAARELNHPTNQLRSSGYESVVLSPENFLRYNDNLLQACILRAAHPSELDYSASPHLSTLMKEFLLKLFSRHAEPYGAAALEFSAALALGRLKLKQDDLKEVLTKSIDQISGSHSPLLGFLLMA